MLNVFKNKFSQIHKQSKEAIELLRFIGPGILVTVGFIDPGNWAANLAAGADYGYALLWVVTLSTLMLILRTDGKLLLKHITSLSVITNVMVNRRLLSAVKERLSLMVITREAVTSYLLLQLL